MAKRHFYIENLIHEKAEKSWKGAVTRKNFYLWEKHWLETAELLKKQFEDEGLLNSAKYVEEVITFNKSLDHMRSKQKDEEVYRFSSGWTAKREYGVVMSPQHQVEILAMGKWVLRDRKGTVVDVDKFRDDMFERHDECAMFEMKHFVTA